MHRSTRNLRLLGAAGITIMACGGSGGDGDSAPDTQQPTVAITAPAPGVVQGTTSVTATAQDDRGVIGVQFRLDGVDLGAEDPEAPYMITWNTLESANGQHELTAVARDEAGNTATAAAVAVTVDNVAPVGRIEVGVSIAGAPLDPAGYRLALDGGPDRPIEDGGTIVFESLPVGTHTFSVGGMGPSCRATPGSAFAAVVEAGATTEVVLRVECRGRIAFSGYSYDRGSSELFLVNTDGSELHRLTNTLDESEGAPAWSPDGRRIVFEVMPPGPLGSANGDIFAMDSDGTNIVRLTDDDIPDRFPKWSPDGTKITFVRGQGGIQDVFVMNSDGSGVTNLTNDPAADVDPSWSPDGGRIVFRSLRDSRDELYVMAADGSGVTPLTDNDDGDFRPAWSPDGERIAFVSNREGSTAIWVMNADGSNPVRLAGVVTTGVVLSWSPDGRRIAYSVSGDLFMIDADGTDELTIVSGSRVDSEPAWRPF